MTTFYRCFRLLCLLLCSLFSPLFAAEEATEIDILLLFDSRSTAAMKEAAKTPEIIANDAMSQLNTVLANSKAPDGSPLITKLRFSLSGFECIDYTGKAEARGTDAGVGRSADHDYVMTSPEVTQLREKYHADLVVLLVGYSIENGGVLGGALAPSTRGIINNAGEEKKVLSNDHFSAVFSLFCILNDAPDHTFAHEIFHLLGCGHSDIQLHQTGPLIIDDSSGFYLRRPQHLPHAATLMTYETGRAILDGKFCMWCRDARVQEDTAHDLTLEKGALTVIPVLSGPYRVADVDENGQKRLLYAGDELHNNVRNALQFSSIVSSYRLSGKEKAKGDTFSDASDMGPAQLAHAPLLRFTRFHLNEVALALLNKLDEKITELLGLGNQDAAKELQEARFCYMNQHLATLASLKLYQDIPEDIIQHYPFKDLNGDYNNNPWHWIWGSNRAAGKEEGEPVIHPQAAGKTVWFRYVPQEDGVAHYRIRESYTSANMVAAVYTGESVDALRLAEQHEFKDKENLSAEDKKLYQGIGSCYVRKGTPVYLAVDSKEAEGGFFNITFCVDPQELPPAPPVGTDTPLRDTLPYIILGSLVCLFAGGMGAAMYKLHRLSAPGSAAAAAPGSVTITGSLSDGRPFSKKLTLKQLQAVHNFYIGSDKKCHLVIHDTGIEPRHAVFKVRNGQLLLGDAGSYSGTTVNNRLLHEDECVRVKGDCICKIGNATLKISTLLPAAAAQQVAPGAPHPGKMLRFNATTSDGERKQFDIPMSNIAAVRNYTIGRASDNMLVLADPTVSGHHAVIKLREGRLLIGDAGSSSGTVTDGISLKQDDCVVIHRNTSGRLGGLHFTITII